MIKRITIGIFLTLGLFSNASSQIKQDICFDTLALKAGEFRMHIREFAGCFSFNKLPSALEPITVTFTLEITTKRTEHLAKPLEEDWKIQLYYYDNLVGIMENTEFNWRGPHKFGDKFEGSFEFVPLKSGLSIICLDFAGYRNNLLPLRPQSGISFEYCLDENGILILLDQYQAKIRDECSTPHTFFFSGDSIIMKQHPDRSNADAFDYEIIITPIPEIGKTSILTYRLHGLRDLNYGINQMVTTKGIDINSLPPELDIAISQNQIIEHSMEFTPRPIRTFNIIALHLTYVTNSITDNIGTQTIPCHFIFNSDSSLKLINDGLIGLHGIKYPDNFPEHDPDRDNKTININVIDVEDFRR